MRVWDNIRSWWYDTKDRHEWISSFNMDFKRAYLNATFPILIKVTITKGHPDYQSQFSRRFLFVSRSGIKLEAMGVSNYFMNKNVATVLAIVILSNDRMCRDLLSLGFDTLWVGDYAWKLENFSLPDPNR